MFRVKSIPLVLALGAFGAAVAVVDARAADYPPSSRDKVEVDPRFAGVADRPQPDYSPVGVRWGSFLFYPALLSSVSYDDNITAVGTNEKADWIFKFRPTLDIKSDWSRHYLSFAVGAESATYANYSDADYVDYFAGGKGRLDITPDMSVSSFLNYLHGHETPGDGQTFNEVTVPVAFDRVDGGIKLDNRFNRLWTSTGFSFRWEDFDQFADGEFIDQTYRNGTTYDAFARVGYDISPLTSVFTQFAYEWTEFEDSLYDGDQYTAAVGLKFEPSRLLRGEAYVGYLDWTSDSGFLDDVAGFYFGGDLAWFATPLLTVSFTADRKIDGSTYNGGSSVLTSDYGVRADYELRRNIIVSGIFAYKEQEYEGNDRTDNKYTYGASLRYLINRYLTSTLNYRYTDFTTNGIDVDDYNRSVVTAGLKLQY